MKKIVSIILLALTLCLVGCGNQQAKYIEKCKEEFAFDYEEEILFVKTDDAVAKGKEVFIVEIYGEKTYARYIYCDGELWNYENQSN